MKTLRYLLISSLLTLSLFSIVTYTACNRDLCKNTICLNSGSCLDGKCTCPPGIEGPNCEIDLCEGKICLNGGMCVSGTCKCTGGFEGENCELTNKFLGAFSATDECNEFPVSYSTGIIMIGNDQPVLRISNMGNSNGYAYGSISSSGNGFILKGDTYEGYDINGSGIYNFSNGNIEVGYTIAYPNGTVACSGVWVRN